VIGTEVPLSILRNCHPVNSHAVELALELYELEDAGFLTSELDETAGASGSMRKSDRKSVSARESRRSRHAAKSSTADLSTSLGVSGAGAPHGRTLSAMTVEGLIFAFKHGFFQAAAYSLLGLEQRKLIHQNVAEYYESVEPTAGIVSSALLFGSSDIRDRDGTVAGEKRPSLLGPTTPVNAPGDRRGARGATAAQRAHQNSVVLSIAGIAASDAANWGILSHHWIKAENWSRALHWTELAGLNAIRVNANREAIKYFETVKEILRAQKLSDVRRAYQCDANLGNALYAMGRYVLPEVDGRLCRLSFRCVICFSRWSGCMLVAHGLYVQVLRELRSFPCSAGLPRHRYGEPESKIGTLATVQAGTEREGVLQANVRCRSCLRELSTPSA